MIASIFWPQTSLNLFLNRILICYKVVPKYLISSTLSSGPGSVVGIVTGYGLDGLVIKSWWRRDFPHLSRPALGPTQPPVQWIPGLSQGKERLGCDADPSPPSSAMVKEEYSYTSTPRMGHTACTEPQCLYKGALYLFFTTTLQMVGWISWIKTQATLHQCLKCLSVILKLSTPCIVWWMYSIYFTNQMHNTLKFINDTSELVQMDRHVSLKQWEPAITLTLCVEDTAGQLLQSVQHTDT